MYQFIETIKIQEGKLCNIDFHNHRFNATRQLFFPKTEAADLNELISIPDDCKKGVFKCRMEYDDYIRSVSFTPYQIKDIKRLKLITCNEIEYNFKFKNRQTLETLFGQRNDCDEILIVKNNHITDTSYSNIIFYDGRGWITPKSPLLKGTKRAYLLAQGIIKEEDILLSGIKNFKKVALINAMLDIEDCQIDIEDIIF